MAEAVWDPRSNRPPANRDDWRKKVRREVTRGLSEFAFDHKTAIDAVVAASIARFKQF
jgi:hypothetical protein